MAAPGGRQPQRVIIEYGEPQAPKKVGVRQHIRSGMRKLGSKVKGRKARADPNEVSPELKEMARDSDAMASILERMG